MDPIKTSLKNTKAWVRKKHSRDFPKNMEGLCAIASHKLFKNLQKRNVAAKIVVGDLLGGGSHCWLEVSEQVFDITSRQFNLRSVSKITRSKYLQRLHEKANIELKFTRFFEFEDEETFLKHLYRNHWPLKQIPKRA